MSTEEPTKVGESLAQENTDNQEKEQLILPEVGSDPKVAMNKVAVEDSGPSTEKKPENSPTWPDVSRGAVVEAKNQEIMSSIEHAEG